MDLEWAREELFREFSRQENAFSLITEEVEKVATHPSGVVFIPHLRGRNCPTQPYLRGVFAGFSWEHKREHLFRAILEGIAFEYAFYLKVIRELIPDLVFNEVRVIGGGAKSAFWNRIKASILGIPYLTLDRGEFAIWGAALCAAFGVGVFADLSAKAKASVRVVNVFHPDEKLYRVYQKYLPYYLETLETMNGVFEKFKEFFI
jgi:xylulokinase